MSAGDFFCAMQGKYDRRASKSKVRPEHQVDDYLDALVSTASKFFAPYAHNFITIATGNHEQSIADRHETNLIERFCGLLNGTVGSKIYSGSFSGWIKFRFLENGLRYNTVNLHYDHGYGGGGPVTADMIQTQRRAVYLPDADIIIHGHTHDQWVREFQRVRLHDNGSITQDTQTHIKLPTYKDEYKDGRGGWATAAKGMPPKPVGAWWLRFYWDWHRSTFLHEVIKAQ